MSMEQRQQHNPDEQPQWFTYKAFGLTFNSEIPFNQAHASHQETADVTIKFGIVPERLDDPVMEGLRYQASPNAFLLDVDHIARFYIRQGNEIIVEPCENAHEDDIRLFLTGSAMGAILHQRQLLPLHASAVEIGGKALLFTGPSGKGKSTLAAGFSKRGHPVLADDICVLSGFKNGTPRVVPGFPQLKLWEDMLERLNEPLDVLKSVRFGNMINKYYLPMDLHGGNDLPVHAVFVLDTHNEPEFRITQITGMQKIESIIESTYRVHFLDGFKLRGSHFELCKKTAEAVSVYQISRPHDPDGFHLDRLMALVEEAVL